MNFDRREMVLDRIKLPARETVPQSDPAETGAGDLQWDDLQYVIEGLMYAPRPVHAAMQSATHRYKLAPKGAYILTLLDQGITFPAELALALRISKSMITKELARLAEAGLISVSMDDADKRRSALSLTAAGKQACEDVRKSMTHMLRRNLGRYSPEQVRLLADMLRDARQLAVGECEI